MDSTGPVRDQGDLAQMVELLLEKGVVINADVVVSVGDTELLGVELRAAIASFETAAKYGLEFPDGTDREKVIEAANLSGEEIEGGSGDELSDRSTDASDGQARSLRMRPGGPAGSGDGGGDTAEPASAADKGAAEAARKTPAGAGDVAIDPAPYDPTREDRDPDVEEPGADHPEVDREGDETEVDETESVESVESDTTNGNEAESDDASESADADPDADVDASTESGGDDQEGEGE